jgi:tetratricopeptide (TPR) repeat protein
MCRTPVRERVPYAGRIAEATELARRAGLAKAAALGAHLLAILYEETNNYSDAADATKQSAEISRDADPATAAVAMATAARCLLLLQRDVARAEELLLQAQAIGLPSHELSLALGYLHAHQGRAAEAVPHLERAWELAAARGDHWSEWIALARLVTLALEEGDPSLALSHCARLHPVAAKMHGGSESVRSEAFECVARHALGEPADVATAIANLREIDSKSDIAWVLSYLAEHEPDRERALAYAAEALRAAEAVGRASEAIIARKILGQPAEATRDISARARQFLKERSHGRHGARAVV